MCDVYRTDWTVINMILITIRWRDWLTDWQNDWLTVCGAACDHERTHNSFAMKFNPGQATLPPSLCLSCCCCCCLFVVACLLLLLLATRHTLSSPQLKRTPHERRLQRKERKRVQLTADIFLCAGRSCKLSKYFQLTNNWVHPLLLCPSSCCPSSHRTGEPPFMLLWLVLSNGTRAWQQFHWIGFQCTTKGALLFDFFLSATAPYLPSLPTLQLFLSSTIRWSLKGTRALSTCPTQVLSAWSWTRFCLKLARKHFPVPE